MRYASEIAKITKEHRSMRIARQLNTIDKCIEDAAKDGKFEYYTSFPLEPEVVELVKLYGYDIQLLPPDRKYRISWGNDYKFAEDIYTIVDTENGYDIIIHCERTDKK